jgi:AcrR family transcriptional regulator
MHTGRYFFAGGCHHVYTHANAAMTSHSVDRRIGGPKQSSRQRDIRETALTLFAEFGYHGTSMENIAEHLGIRAPSLYSHMESKQALLRDIMLDTLHDLFDDHRAAVASSPDIVDQLRRAMEAHVRFHARHPREVRIGMTESASLDEPARTEIRRMHRDYWAAFRTLVERGIGERRFETPSPRLACHAIIEMGMGIALWYRADGPLSESQIAYYYSDLALRLVGATSRA